MIDNELASRLKKIRESLAISITEAAEKLGFANYQTLSEIEKGKREVKASELALFSKLYYCTIDTLLGLKAEREKISFKWRNPPAINKNKIEKKILYLCEQYHLLENLLNIEPKKFPLKVEIEDISDKQKINELASKVYNLLVLGSRPAFSLQKILEQNYYIKILFESSIEGSSVSAVDKELGNIIVINKNEAPWRQNYDLGHELFHLITWEAVVENQNNDEISFNEDLEKKANLFSSFLLLPGNEVKDEILTRYRASRYRKQLSYSDLIDIALDFGVSTQALIYRMYDLGFIPDFKQAEKISNDPNLLQENKTKRTSERKEKEAERFIQLAIRCLRKGLISRGKFAELMYIDRSDIDSYIEGYGSIGEEGTQFEITVA
jgi:Zn-dependent peptidase ImmA (M78 family)/DNA-binding XRE family transcriptional regulator